MTGHLSSAWSLHRAPEWAGLCCDACLDGTAGTGALWVPPFVCNGLLFWETPGVTTGGTKDLMAPLSFLTTGLSLHLVIYKNSVSPVQPILSIVPLIWGRKTCLPAARGLWYSRIPIFSPGSGFRDGRA